MRNRANWVLDADIRSFFDTLSQEWLIRLVELRERLAKFGFELHPDKTRLIEFGRNAGRGGGGKPPTFNFLGFTHSCGKTRKGYFTVLRQTMRTRWQAKPREVKAELRRRRHCPIPELGADLRSVVSGHIRYHGMPRNGPAIGGFRKAIGWLWWRAFARRNQTAYVPWQRKQGLIAGRLPPAHICHPHPPARFAVTTQGKSRMR
jgi:RNA-directed DNA polymerase